MINLGEQLVAPKKEEEPTTSATLSAFLDEWRKDREDRRKEWEQERKDRRKEFSEFLKQMAEDLSIARGGKGKENTHTSHTRISHLEQWMALLLRIFSPSPRSSIPKT